MVFEFQYANDSGSDPKLVNDYKFTHTYACTPARVLY